MGIFLCAEFPCDNPALVESGELVFGAPFEMTPPVRESGIVLREALPDTFEVESLESIESVESEIVVEDLPPLEIEETVETILPPAPDDPFVILANAVADVAMAEGQPLVAASVAPMLLDGHGLDEKADGVRRAWRAILDGTSEDFDACGGAMLDEWCAGLLAALLGMPGKTDALRRELRARGVAAFGLAA